MNPLTTPYPLSTISARVERDDISAPGFLELGIPTEYPTV